jgi:hypothetical protein
LDAIKVSSFSTILMIILPDLIRNKSEAKNANKERE